MITGFQEQKNDFYSTVKNFYVNEKDALKATLLEAVAYESIFQIVSPYMSPRTTLAVKASISSLFTQSALIRQFNVLFRTAIQNILGEEKDKKAKKDVLYIHKICSDFILAYNLSEPFTYLKSLAHEYGHYFAVKLFEKPQTPIITIVAGGGNCEWTGSELFRAKCVAAGPAAQIVFATAFIAAGHFQKPLSYSSMLLNLVGVNAILSGLNYANSSFTQLTNHSHDFVYLWKKVGIHPYVAMVSMVALPLLVKSGLVLSDLYMAENQQKNKNKDYLDQLLNDLLKYKALSPDQQSWAQRTAAAIKNDPYLYSIVNENPDFKERLNQFDDLISENSYLD